MKKLKLLLLGILPSILASSQLISTESLHRPQIARVKIVSPAPPARIESVASFAICDDCRDGKFNFEAPPPQLFASSSAITFNQPITIITTPPKIIKNIQADLVYFEMVPDDDLCFPCNKDDKLYGHFLNATNNQQWDGPQNNLNITILTPVTPCCGTNFRWCIRYRVEFSDCTVCTKLVCYELRKEGCLPDRIITDNNKRNNQSN